MRYTTPYMDFVMTPPQQEEAKYNMYVPQVSTMKVLSDARTTGLGEVSLVGSSGSSSDNSWMMPVVVIVVSAMALMTLYAVLSRK